MKIDIFMREDFMRQGHMTSLQRIIQKLIKKYLESIFEIVVEKNVTKEIAPSYLLIGNHQNNWDGFIMSIYVNDLISFVISDEQYRNPIIRRLLKYIHAIPTIKAKVDISTIKGILKAKKENRIIGLFPEGNRTWDGRTQPIYYSTAKLIKLLNIPVVTAKFKGGHLAHPRWAKHYRKGKIKLSYDLLFSVEDLGSLSVEQIYQKLVDVLDHDEFAYQTQKMLPYRGKKLAEKLEYFLFACPNCQSLDRMESSNNKLYCKQCGHVVEYTEYGSFQPVDSDIYYDSPRDWNSWQLQFLKETLALLNPSLGETFASDGNIILKQGEKQKPLKKVSMGHLELDENHLYYIPQNGSRITIPIEKLEGLNLQIKNQLDFYYNDQLYRFSFSKSKESPYKWLNAIEIVRENRKQNQQKIPNSK